ncbi:MAG: tryptophan--tRNA ligase [Rickettsiales bacterium]|nr:tryptophan--tRNA ligase [Rickettsiales bacterium]
MNKNSKIVFSGVQPTGNLHLGNYLGAIKNWVDLQKENQCIFCIVDLHAVTTPENRNNLKSNSLEVAAAYIASGIDPKKNIIFCQSQVSGHTELAWILSCFCPIGWLNRMTQFKDKAGKNKEKAALGLYSYPVLMASDILLYRSTHVPVGEDQKQHLELSRDVAQSFNRSYGVDFFPVPEPLILGNAKRVMSLKNGLNKMSKSDKSDQSRINLLDDADIISRKIRKSKTDSLPFPNDQASLENRPEIKNLINIYSSLTEMDIEKILLKYSQKNFSIFKNDLANVIVEHFSKITYEIKKILDDKSYLKNILTLGSEKANDIASVNIKKIKEIVGFL